MKLLSRVLIPLTFLSFATSQTMNLGISDAIRSRASKKLRASQNKLKDQLFTFASDVRRKSSGSVSSSKKVKSTMARIDICLNDLADFASEMGTIESHSEFKNSSTNCYDINEIISLMEFNLMKYRALEQQAKTNSSLIQSFITTCTTIAKADRASVNLTSTVTLGKEITANYLEYMKNLQESFKAETTVKANLENYRRGKCICSAEQTMGDSTQFASFIKTVTDADATFINYQGTLKTSITTSTSKVSAAVNTKVSNQHTFYLQQLLVHFKKVSSVSDNLKTNLTSPTSCRQLLDVIGRICFRAWYLVQNGYVAKRNLTIAERYAMKLKAATTVGTVITKEQNATIEAAVSSVTPVIEIYSKYLLDSGNLNPKVTLAGNEMKKLSEKFCLCRSDESTTTTLETTTSTSTTTTTTTSTTTPTTTTTTTPMTTTTTTTTTPKPTTTTSTSTTLRPTTTSTLTTTPIPTTSIPTTTAPLWPSQGYLIEPNAYGPLNSSACSKILSITVNGTYMKTGCHITKAANHTESRKLCRSSGMELYSIANENDYKGLANFMQTIFNGSGACVRTDGIQQNYNGVLGLYNFNPNRTLFWSNATPVMNAGVSGCVMAYFTSNVFKIQQLSCETNSTIICEYVEKPNTSPNSELVEPNVYGPLNVTVCRSTSNIFDLNGVYNKSICYLAMPGNHTTSRGLCRSFGMELFAIQKEADLKGVMEFTKLVFGSTANIAVRIDGTQQQCNGTQFCNFNPKRSLLWSGCNPILDSTQSGCLAIIQNSTYLNVFQLGCEKSTNTYCEFVKAPSNSPTSSNETQAPTTLAPSSNQTVASTTIITRATNQTVAPTTIAPTKAQTTLAPTSNQTQAPTMVQTTTTAKATIVTTLAPTSNQTLAPTTTKAANLTVAPTTQASLFNQTQSPLVNTTTTVPPCGTLLPFPVTSAAGVTTTITIVGFNSGIYKDGSTLFPGSGTYDAARRPGRISTKSPAGAYLASQGLTAEYYDGTTAKYFAPHPQLKWVLTTIEGAINVTGKVGVECWAGYPQKHFVTRHNLTGYQQIGALWALPSGGNEINTFYFDAGAVVYSTRSFEVLVCQ